MQVFVDTNILLNFFHYSSEDLDNLHNVFASHEHGSATVHVTDQVRDEFNRNREIKLYDAFKTFKKTSFSLQLPSFLKGYDEYAQIRRLAKQLETARAAILDNADQDIANTSLVADKLIGQIFDSSEIAETTPEIYQDAKQRVSLGNPPGKNGSLGDAINWLILLSTVNDQQDLHIITEDADFYSPLSENRPNQFLAEEWKTKKNASLFVYRTLAAFTTEHFDGVAFSFDSGKEVLIDELHESGSFSETHQIITKLESHGYFSAKEANRILDSVAENSQVGSIVTDRDVSDFLNRIAVPHRQTIDNPEHITILDKVVEEKRNRESEDD